MIKISFQLDKQQREEIRRLTQKANRRLIQTKKKLEQLDSFDGVIPYKIIGTNKISQKYMFVDKWTTKAPISRSIQFESAEEYKQHVKFLRQFDLPEEKGGLQTFKQFSTGEQDKIRHLFDKFGILTREHHRAISKMDLDDINEFWRLYDQISSQLFDDYDSERAFQLLFSSEEFKQLMQKSIQAALPKRKKKE